MGTTIPLSDKSSESFCELNQKWFEEKHLPAFSYLEPHMLEIANLRRNNFEVLNGISKVATPNTEDHSLFTLYANKTNENYLSIQNKKGTMNDKGDTKFDSNDVVTHLRINEEFSSFLESI